MTEPKSLPKWILIVSALIALLELGGSAALCFAPESLAESVDLDAKGVRFLIYMWSSRQFALGVIFAYATLKRSASMLTVSYIFLLVMFAGDMTIGIWQQEMAMIGMALVMCIL